MRRRLCPGWQCIPTPLAWWAHQSPEWLLKLGGVATYVVEVPLPIMLSLTVVLTASVPRLAVYPDAARLVGPPEPRVAAQAGRRGHLRRRGTAARHVVCDCRVDGVCAPVGSVSRRRSPGGPTRAPSGC